MNAMTVGSATRPADTGQNRVIEQLLTDEETFGTTMLAIVTDRFGPSGAGEERLDCLTWTAATLREELYQAYRVEPLPGNIDRLMVAIDIVTSDSFWNDIDAFIRGCNVMAGSDANFTDFDPATVAESAWGVAEAILLWPDEDEDPAFPSDEIRAYIVEQLRQEGFSRPPTILSEFVQPGQLNEVAVDFEDPDINLGMSKSSDARADEVDSIVRNEMDQLIRQLESIPFRHGKTKQLATLIRKGLQNAPISNR